MSRSKFPTLVVVDRITTFIPSLANTTAGTIVLDRTAPGAIWQVGLNGTTKTLFQLDPAGSLTPWVTRSTTFVVTPGAPASGSVAYAGVVSNSDGAGVPRAVILIGVQRSLGAGAISFTLTVGSLVSLIETGDEIAAVIQATAAGAWGFSVTGTAADEIDTAWATDAATGGVTQTDAGRVLP